VLYELFMKEKGEVLSVDSRADLSAKAPRARGPGLRAHEVRDRSDRGGAVPRAHSPAHRAGTRATPATTTPSRGAEAQRDHVALVPCCQAEVAQQLKDSPAEGMRVLYEHPMHRREFGSHITKRDPARWMLEAHGYSVTSPS